MMQAGSKPRELLQRIVLSRSKEIGIVGSAWKYFVRECDFCRMMSVADRNWSILIRHPTAAVDAGKASLSYFQQTRYIQHFGSLPTCKLMTDGESRRDGSGALLTKENCAIASACAFSGAPQPQ
jgi:hypothetical protein